MIFFVTLFCKCVPFTYSGCGGTENLFITLKDCKKTCSPLAAGSGGGPTKAR